MSAADHPAGRARRCTIGNCPELAMTRVAAGNAPATTFLTVQPLSGRGGQLACLDHAHHLVDVMLLKATPEPTR